MDSGTKLLELFILLVLKITHTARYEQLVLGLGQRTVCYGIIPKSIFQILIIGDERQQRNMPRPLDSDAQTALLAFGEARLLASFNLPVDVDVALQGLEILVVEKGY